MTKDELVAQTREIFDLWNAHDAPGLARFYVSGTTVRDSAYPDNAATGQDAAVERARMILDGFSDAMTGARLDKCRWQPRLHGVALQRHSRRRVPWRASQRSER
jgi:hypothetical protein